MTAEQRAEMEKHAPVVFEVFGWSCTCRDDWTGPGFVEWREHFAAAMLAVQVTR